MALSFAALCLSALSASALCRALTTALGSALLEFGIGLGHAALCGLFKEWFIAIVFRTAAAAGAENIYFAGAFARAANSIIKAVEGVIQRLVQVFYRLSVPGASR